MTQRRRQLDSKRSSSINTEQTNGNTQALVAAVAAARRRNQHRNYPLSNRSRLDYIYKNFMKRKFPINIPSYVVLIIVGLLLALISYRIVQTIIDYRQQYEYTNIPSSLDKLVHTNYTTPVFNAQRFWGTYR
jgi:hypothetical protein